MQKEHQIVKSVYAAKGNSRHADELIRSYLPFIRSEAAKFTLGSSLDPEDGLSIAMMAFYEAVMGYDRAKGNFLSYAALLIRSRLIDFSRREARHQGHISLDEERGEEDGRRLADSLSDGRDRYEEAAHREATRQEIEELSAVLDSFGVSFADVADNCPKQDRTREACARAIRYAGENRPLLNELLRSRKLPLAQLALGSGTERKTLERHRKYVLAMLLIQTNGYEIIRGHLYRVLNRKGGIPA